MTSLYTNRQHFAVLLRTAIRQGRLKDYAKHRYGYTRMATLTDGTYLLYRHNSCPIAEMEDRHRDDDDGRTYADPRDEREERDRA